MYTKPNRVVVTGTPTQYRSSYNRKKKTKKTQYKIAKCIYSNYLINPSLKQLFYI